METTDSLTEPLKALEQYALRALARREHTRRELRDKFESRRGALSEEALEALLDRLERLGYLSDERAAEALVRARKTGRGVARIAAELQDKGVPATTIQALTQPLKEDEFQRAQAVWARKFKAVPGTPQEYARQGRFLLGRGFSMSVIHRLLGKR